MSEPNNISDLAKAAQALSEPARLAIEKIAGGTARLFEPIHVRRMARAQADAKFIEEVGKRDVAELAEAYSDRRVYRAARKELNLRLIADRAAEHLSDDAQEHCSVPDDDWVDEFCEHAEKAGTDGLRELWSRIYAGEVKTPGSVPRRVMRQVRDLDQGMAVMFQKVAGCTVLGKVRVLFLLDNWEAVIGVNLFELKELADLSLIDIPVLNQQQVLETGQLTFFNRVLMFRKASENPTPISFFALTRFGEILFKVSDAQPNEPFFNALIQKMRTSNWSVDVFHAGPLNVK